MTLLSSHLLATRSKAQWKRIGTAPRSGVSVPLFTLHSRDSCGIGDFADLKLLVDWCAKTGNSIIQLLPLNILGGLFCPYDSFSSFALEPAYFSFDQLAAARTPDLQEKIARLKQRFPSTAERVDYRIKDEKINLLWEIFVQESLSHADGFEQFKTSNAYWLDDFAMFMVLKNAHGRAPWYEWKQEYRDRTSEALELFRGEHAKEITFQMWVQWQLYGQLRDAQAYARSKGVLLKGDLPILVSRDSADVWAHPQFFKLEYASGAPPDMYCAKGQRWGMPTYNWERIANDGYLYVRQKLRYARHFYDIIRIDHVVGLFRIWSIPCDDPLVNQGLNGVFDPRDEKLWARHGSQILSVMLESADMLLCAEDLGVIPKVCTQTLEKLGIPGNDVQRWIKEWKTKHDFLSPGEYRQLAVAMLSTHDTTNWSAWWENEAGTIDEGLFMRKCNDRKINGVQAKDKLFCSLRSRHGRLRWKDEITSVDILVWNLGKKKEELADFIDLYQNSYREKEKLWKQMGLAGEMRETCDSTIVTKAFEITLNSAAVFCIETIIDWLYLGGVFEGDPYQHRFNTPGTTGCANWSLRLPLSLEELLKHKVCSTIKEMVAASGRI